MRDAQELPAAFALMKQRQADAMLVASGGPLFQARAQVGDLALQYRLPAIAAFKEYPQTGLLMSYGPDLPDINRRAAGYVDKIFKGAKPGAEYVDHYHGERNHQGLDNRLIRAVPSSLQEVGMVRRKQRLGGMLNFYCREAVRLASTE